mmetsp:Transcript_1074/g.1852  ORF Transcript_1074/g.1852 Transcript_1074/m.1852 type:complete len:313 (-) Transcript_1074:73-1011(-)
MDASIQGMAAAILLLSTLTAASPRGIRTSLARKPVGFSRGFVRSCARSSRTERPRDVHVSASKRTTLLGLLASMTAYPVSRAGAEEAQIAGEPDDPEKGMTAIERLRERQRKALGQLEAKAEKFSYEDGSTTLVYPIGALEDMRVRDPVVRQRLASPGRGGSPKDGFPYFVRDGFTMKMFLPDDFQRSPDGLFYKKMLNGDGGNSPKDGQKVTFDFTAYNENGDQIDSSLRKQEPPSAKLGLGTIVPGVEIALKQMSVGEKWRIIVSPDLGPPTGPSTFFSAKQFETFDIELKDFKTCTSKQTAFVTTEECV